MIEIRKGTAMFYLIKERLAECDAAELSSPYAYPTVIAVCVLIVIISLIFFKKKKWL